MKKIFFNKFKHISLSNFKKISEKLLMKEVLKGNIIIVKNAVSKKNLLKICNKIDKKKLINSRSKRMVQGVKNIFYEVYSDINEKKDAKKYNVSNRSWYFFPWNRDTTKLSRLIQPLFDKVLRINGYEPKKILKQTPRDGIIQRFHLMNYPIGKGYISSHIDPSHIIKVNSGIYVSEFNKEYDEGGFYVLNKNKKKINIDKQIKSSDLVLFYASMPHGVDVIKKNNKRKNQIENGRWFLNMTLVSSHHVKNRVTSKGI